MSKISTWSTTAADNNSASPNGAPEGMPSSGVNNTIRENMAQVRTERENTEWFDWGLTPTYINATSFSLVGDVTTEWHVGRRVRLTDASTLYATILTSTYTSLTTITLTMDSGSVSASLTAVELSVLSSSNNSIPGSVRASWNEYTASGTTASLAQNATELDTITHGLGSDDVEVYLFCVDSSGSGEWSAAFLTADDYSLASMGFGATAVSTPLPNVASSGNVEIAIKNLKTTSQTITYRIIIRKRTA